MKMNLDGLHDLLGNEAVTEAVALLVLEVEGFHEMRPKILKCKVTLVIILIITKLLIVQLREYSRASRNTIFGEWKNPCSSK